MAQKKKLSKAQIDRRVLEAWTAVYGEHRRDNLKKDLRAIDRAEAAAKRVREELSGK